MTLDEVACKTNEFQQRRKLRLQQVREQSKDIAKKIRHRAKVEKLRHAVNADNRKEREYFECQEKFVKCLQQIYSENLKNIGKAHADILGSNEGVIEKKDLSKLRGKEAVAELKRKKQEKLDEQKKILDRKLKAREVANELSREKSLTVVQKLSKELNKEEPIKDNQVVVEKAPNNANEDCEIGTNDIGVQWESPKLPATSQPEEPTQINSTDKNKKINLFALSDEMTLNMNEELAKSSDRPAVKPSLTMVSEYLQNRNLRLREGEPTKRKPTEDLQSIKQTILQTRAPKADGSIVDSVHVLDKQILPLPSWHSENKKPENHIKHTVLSNICQPLNLNKMHQSPRQKHKTGNKQRSFRSTTSHDSPSKRSLVTVYDHTTKDSRCLPCGDGGFVYREEQMEDDAYSNAYKETTAASDQNQEAFNKQQKDMRGKIAMHRQNVDKEYRETLSFLNSIQKDITAPSMSNACYITEEQQKRQRELHQKKLEEEFKKVQKENCKHSCKHSRKKVVMSDRNCARSPKNVENNKFQYSWMPVPESDGSLAIHTLPVKEKSNSVKFSHVNSYHEYRSRHKHTPPTKDVSDKPKRVVETVVVENESSECNSSAASETCSVQDLNLEKDDHDKRLLDADRIIIYKILNSKKDKSSKERKKQVKTPELIDRQTASKNPIQNEELLDFVKNLPQNSLLQEGIYKAVKNNRFAYKVTRVGSGVEMSQTSVKWNSWWDNIEATCVADRHQENKEHSDTSKSCKCINNIKDKLGADHGTFSQSNSRKCDHCRSISEQSPTSSFRTARNDIKCTSNDGYIKLIDSVNQENNKFYIGASGFLKDSDYEVIIQLRKKDGENTDKNVMTDAQSVDSPAAEVLENNTIKTHSLLPDKDVATSNDSGICQEQAEVADTESQNIEPDSNINLNDKNSAKAVESETSKPKTCEKAVHTSFHNSFMAPDNVPKTEPAVKTAASTCTQTNFSSPTPRPPFMHMSTSTSTAYMSPPDVILPRLMRQNYDPTTDPYDSSNSISNGRESNLHRNFFKCKRNKQKHCNCAKCELKIRCPSRKTDSRKTTSATPPNTCRTIYRCEKSKIHCAKHRKRSDKNSNKCNGSKRPTSSTADSLKTANAINTFNSRYHTRLTKSQIDPVVKKYINKLLNLNQEGLKAIEIINQDCSDVATPSNSVINVPSNVNKLNCAVENKISLEQIKEIIKNEIISRNIESTQIKTSGVVNDKSETTKPKKLPQAFAKKRYHKVKSLNISKKVLKNNSSKKTPSQRFDINSVHSKTSNAVDSKRTEGDDTVDDSQVLRARKHNTSSPVPRSDGNQLNCSQSSLSKVYSKIANVNEVINNALHKHSYLTRKANFISSDSDTHDRVTSYVKSAQRPHRMSSKTNDVTGSDIDCMKIAEYKIQNIEKLADLTEKCTKRISNLAKVLEEVRKNKSLVYSQISSTEVSSGSSDNKSDTSVHKDQNFLLNNSKNKEINDNIVKSSTNTSGNNTDKNGLFGFVLKDILKPDTLKSTKTSDSAHIDNLREYSSSNSDSANVKYRTKPPPALKRHLKHGPEIFVAPHELSTVVEVDSPMSVQLKSQSKHNINPQNIPQFTETPGSDSYSELKVDKNQNILHKSNSNKSRTESLEDSKLLMMDMKQFNDIMLKPFVSFKEYAKQYNIQNFEDGSVIDDTSREFPAPDVISNSENSLPDVMTELLKRNVISEPFKFDTSSNKTSTSLSSESTASLLALTKTQKKKKFLEAKLKLQKSLIDTSETLSTSSNPDLENAFQKLGIGWASSTLKKTKERLALTSSSSTSSTSLRKFNMKSFNLELPTLGTDSVSSLMSIKDDNKKSSFTKGEENIRNAVQQTSPKCSMTVKEFLNTELAKKITFDNSKSKAVEEFMSLYETKMPDEIKNPKAIEEHSISTSSPNNRARTSTPVRNVFKSATYQTSSSSNTSNGLFSNADDLSSVKGTSNSIRNHSTSDKEDLTIPNYSLKLKKGSLSKSD